VSRAGAGVLEHVCGKCGCDEITDVQWDDKLTPDDENIVLWGYVCPKCEYRGYKRYEIKYVGEEY
jgi:predicted nucleic-acid-binding Zn-ribbon protein